MTAGPTPWPALLDALDERLRRLADLAAGSADGAVPELDLEPDGPLPPELRLRTAVLLATTRQLETEVVRRRAGVLRALRYNG